MGNTPRDTSAGRSEERWADKDVFTTGEAAEVCNVSQQTIIRCFDSGRLRGFRVPGSRFRRIPRADLIRFMQSNGIPSTSLAAIVRRALLISADPTIAEALGRSLTGAETTDLHVAVNPFDAGLLLEQLAPQVIVIDVDTPGIDGRLVLQRIRASSRLAQARVAVIGGNLRGEASESLVSLGATAVLRKPVDAATLLTRLDDAAA